MSDEPKPTAAATYSYGQPNEATGGMPVQIPTATAHAFMPCVHARFERRISRVAALFSIRACIPVVRRSSTTSAYSCSTPTRQEY